MVNFPPSNEALFRSSNYWVIPVECSTLTELRCSLFFEARRDRHSGGMATDEELIRDLLRAIREKVKAGELD